MSKIIRHSHIVALASICVVSAFASAQERPNILWLTTEDHGPHLGCYGDPDAVTPNLDAFAGQSLRFTRASSNAPICAPARTTLATGVYASALGAHHMRSSIARPAELALIPELLRKLGYHCTNNAKTDYNLIGDGKGAWNENSAKAHYRNRPSGTPFFAVFNTMTTHESQLRNENPEPLHNPAKIALPPYHPDTPEVRRDWAQYHDRITQMDRWFGKHLADLEKAGLADDTIVFFFSDHGSGMPRDKRYAGWSGLHIPLLVRIPEKFRHLRPPGYAPGGTSDRLVSFVDFAPTLLSLLGEPARPWHQGRAFLGTHLAPPPPHSFGFVGRADERPDESRSATDGRFLYLRNLMPHVPLNKGLDYQMQTPTTRIWQQQFDAGKLNAIQAAAWTAPRPVEELYDLAADPHETRNLADARPDVLEKLRAALTEHLIATRDLGLLPESSMHALAAQHSLTPGDFARSKHFDPAALVPPVPADDWLPLAVDDAALLAARLRAGVVRASELLEKNPRLRPALDAWLTHEAAEVRVAAAEWLSRHPASRKRAVGVLIACADPSASDPFAALHALDALSRLDTLDAAQLQALREIPTKTAAAWPDKVMRYPRDLHANVVGRFSRPAGKGQSE